MLTGSNVSHSEGIPRRGSLACISCHRRSALLSSAYRTPVTGWSHRRPVDGSAMRRVYCNT